MYHQIVRTVLAEVCSVSAAALEVAHSIWEAEPSIRYLSADADQLFDRLLAPTIEAFDANANVRRLVIIVDGLDELPESSRSRVLNLLMLLPSLNSRLNNLWFGSF